MLNDCSGEKESGPLTRESTWQRPSSEQHPVPFEKGGMR
jgi:hypothetical protein